MSAGLFATARKGALTCAEVDRAKAAIGPRATPSMIAKYLGRPVVDVLGILAPTDAPPAVVPPPQPKPVAPKKPMTARDRRFVDLWNEGSSLREIAEDLGLCRSHVARIRENLGLPARPEPKPRWSKTEITKMVELQAKGLSYAQIGKRLGRSKTAVDAQMQRARDAGLMPRAA